MGWLAVAVYLIAGFAGCTSRQSDRVAVSGRVTYQGELVADGTILFSPVDSDHYQANAAIENGRYVMDAAYGPSLGEYAVRIEGFRSTDNVVAAGPLHASEDGADTVNVESYIPAQYNSQTSLRVTVTRDNCRSLHFDLSGR